MSETEAPSKDRYIVPALMQGLSVLSLFSRDRPGLTAPEIAQELGLSRTTVFRILHTLQTTGYVSRRDEERVYRLGPAVLSRGFVYLASLDVVELARPALIALRDATGLSTHMAVRDGREVVYVARFPAATTVNSSVQIGTRFPIHATVMGRMMICDWSEAELRALFPELDLPAFTEQTPRSLAALEELLAADRARGYAVSQSFFERGVSSVAAPVRDDLGRTVATINATSVDNYVSLDDMNGRIKDAVLAAAAEISQWMSGKAT
ncbi:MAG: IclR family transcriptional regulator [Siculibacillus sp.]|nr:IclR family transcriptional regulator [Siculibacillus sp.]